MHKIQETEWCLWGPGLRSPREPLSGIDFLVGELETSKDSPWWCLYHTANTPNAAEPLTSEDQIRNWCYVCFLYDLKERHERYLWVKQGCLVKLIIF